MKLHIYIIALSLLSAQENFAGAQEGTNGFRVVTQANVPPRAHGGVGIIASNTPAFEQYALPRMLVEVNSIREKWKLPIPFPLTTNNSYISLKAGPYGIDGAVSTKDGRFRWNYWRNNMSMFADTNYYPYSFRYHDDESARLTKIKSKIDAKEAEAIARDYLHKIELTEKQLECIEPPAINQYKFEESDGTVYPLPMFSVAWKVKGFNDAEDFPTITIDVSGITKSVAEYSNLAPKRPLVPMPTNYYDMLGVKPPTNDSQRFGLRPLELLHPATNAPAK